MVRTLLFHRIIRLAIAAIGAMAICLTVADLAQSAESTFRRFVFVVGVNNGGGGRVLLQYAHSDAEAVAKVMQELGGVAPEDTFILTEPNRNGLETGFRQLKSTLAEARRGGQRVEVLFYYSGHSDEKGLLLQGDHFIYRDVRQAIDQLPADVRIAVVDSCASGALTRGKGGIRRSAFLVDTSSEVSGHAFLTSASADEAAQESDRIGGSFFTHHLVSGLRGAADDSRDGRVSINEAYHYAFNETLAQTESTLSGPQHPNYDIQLAGSGDLVMTDISGVSAQLVFPAETAGRFFIRNAKGQLVAEVNKRAGRPMVIGLEPGEYKITVQEERRWLKGLVLLEDGKKTILPLSQFTRTEPEKAIARGSAHTLEEMNLRPMNFSFLPGLNTNYGAPRPVKNNFSVNLLLDWSDYLSGAEFGFIGSIRKYDVRGMMGSGGFNYVGGDLTGAQFAALNLNMGHVKGFQAAIANGAGSIRGAQMGHVNVALKDLYGVQGGLVNWAGHISGVQLGLVNMAIENDGVPIGLVNYAGNGMLIPTFWTSDTSVANLALKMGSKTVFGLYGVGLQPLRNDGWFSGILGLGGHMDWNPWWLEIDMTTHNLFPLEDPGEKEEVDIIAKLRFLVGHRVHPDVSIYFGPTLNLMASSLRTDVGPDISFAKRTVDLENEDFEDESDKPPFEQLHFKFYPGFVVGVQFEPKIVNLNRLGK